MIAQRLSADIRWVVAGAPDYLERFGTPRHPSDLRQHRCLRIRLGDDRIYRWEFERDGEKAEIAAPGTVTIDDTPVGLALAARGAGLLFAAEPMLTPLVVAGQVSLVLEDWAAWGPGYHLYYSSRRQLPAGLRLLIDLIREMKPLGL
jgi:DNA-binding transcriptional LysR family regulator